MMTMVDQIKLTTKSIFVSTVPNTPDKGYIFYNKILRFQILGSLIPVNELITESMNSSIYFINIKLIKFISSCFDSRDTLLSM